jgi:hypothetical protein
LEGGLIKQTFLIKLPRSQFSVLKMTTENQHDNDKPDEGIFSFTQAAAMLQNGKGFDLTASALALSHGIPIPPSLIGRVRHGLGRLVDSTFSAAARAIDRRTERADYDLKEQRKLVSKVAAQGLPHIDPMVAEAIAMGFINDYALKHKNKTEIAALALIELEKSDLTSDEFKDSKLDIDWLNFFSDVSAQKSSPEMQSILARILAGEIRQPGKFSPLTIQVISTLTQEAAQLFERLAQETLIDEGTAVVLVSKEESERSSGIPRLDLLWPELAKLQSHGLITSPQTVGYNVTGSENVIVRNKRGVMAPNGVTEANCFCILMTQSGRELCEILSFDEEFDIEKWGKENLAKYNLSLVKSN